MSDFIVPVKEIKDDVLDLPNSDRLSIIKIDGYLCIQAKNEDGSHFYKKGDLVVYIPESAVVPEWVLKKLKLWNEETKKGVLHGGAGNIVKAKRLRGTFSQGLLYPIKNGTMEIEDGKTVPVSVDQDVSQYLTIEKFEAPIPKKMSGFHCNLSKYTMKYDFENIQGRMSLFDEGEEVRVLEKGHGTHVCFGYIPKLSHKELLNGNLYASSKGIHAKGLVFKNHKILYPKWIDYVPFFKNKLKNKLQKIVILNEKTIYQNMLRDLYHKGLVEWLQKLAETHQAETVHVFGEIFGKGIQDLDYGFNEPVLRIFDIAVNNNFLPFKELQEALSWQTICELFPVLYVGPYNYDALLKYRDGKTTFGSKHVKEGVVVTSTTEATHVRYGRKIGKLINPDYLLRKNADATEHQ
jgi:RNA ligase (TIGR02306 family)